MVLGHRLDPVISKVFFNLVNSVIFGVYKLIQSNIAAASFIYFSFLQTIAAKKIETGKSSSWEIRASSKLQAG